MAPCKEGRKRALGVNHAGRVVKLQHSMWSFKSCSKEWHSCEWGIRAHMCVRKQRVEEAQACLAVKNGYVCKATVLCSDCTALTCGSSCCKCWVLKGSERGGSSFL